MDLKSIFHLNSELDDKGKNFLDIITSVLERSNLPGFDYLEFKQSLDALEKMNMDKQTAIKSAFATASTVGLTKEKLLNTASHYLEILGKEKDEFEDAMQNQIKVKVEGKKEEVKKLRTMINNYKKEIEKLEAQIQDSQKTIDSSDLKIRQEADKIEQTKISFDTIFKSIHDIISRDMENFNQYL